MERFALETVRTRGRAGKPVQVTASRELTAAELESLGEERGVKPVPIKRLRERHHALARCLADGMTETEAGITCGYSASRVSILKADPTFAELVKFYQGAQAEKYLGMHELLAELGVESTQELLERLEDNPDTFDVRDLLEMVKVGADRSGFGPATKQEVNHTVNFGQRLEAARRRMIDITPEEKT